MTSQQEQLGQWLHILGQRQGLELTLDADGSICIFCEGDLQVFVELPSDSPLLCMYAPMLRLPDDLGQQNHLLKQALQLNLFSLETGAASLAYDERTDSIMLTFAADFDTLDEAVFAEALGDFIDLAVRVTDLWMEGPAAEALAAEARPSGVQLV